MEDTIMEAILFQIEIKLIYDAIQINNCFKVVSYCSLLHNYQLYTKPFHNSNFENEYVNDKL